MALLNLYGLCRESHEEGHYFWVQTWIKATALCQEGIAVVSSRVVMAASHGILKAYDRQRLADELEDDEAGSGVEYIRLNRHWA